MQISRLVEGLFSKAERNAGSPCATGGRVAIAFAVVVCLGLLSSGAASAEVLCAGPYSSGESLNVNCEYTNEPTTFTVPAGVKSVTLDVKGGQGGSASGSAGGDGGEEQARVPVQPGEVLTVLVGGPGYSPFVSEGGPGGYGGGASGGDGSGGLAGGGGGGGGSFVFDAAGNLLIAAGGGGGSGSLGSSQGEPQPGAGGGAEGTQGLSAFNGGGGTQSAGGSGGSFEGIDPAMSGAGPAAWLSGSPVPGAGGKGAPAFNEHDYGGGGGGGGYYGGGGGFSFSGGGGGSGYLSPSVSEAVSIVGANEGSGDVLISYALPTPTATISSPASGGTYKEGESVPTSFSCTEAEAGPGLESCLDSNGSSSPGNLNTSTPGSHSYTVTATSKDGQKTTAQITYTVAAPDYALTVSKAGSGSGTITSTPAGIECGGSCSANYEEGSVVTLTAKPASGSSFTGWSGAGCSGTGTCEVRVDSDQTITATFTASGSGESTPPTCTLMPEGDGVVLPPPHGAHQSPATGELVLDVRCQQTASIVLGGVVKELLGFRHGGPVYTSVPIAPLYGSVRANVSTRLYLPLPQSALKALAGGTRESVSLTLAATDSGGTRHVTAYVANLRGEWQHQLWGALHRPLRALGSYGW